MCGVAWVFHPDNPRFPPVDTGDGAHLHARGVRDVDFGADEGVVGTIPPPKVVLGAGVAFVARGGGGAWGGRPVSYWGGCLHPMSHPTQNAIRRFS